MSRKSIILIAALLLHATAATGQWFNADWVARRSVKVVDIIVKGKDAEIASLAFPSGELLTGDGRDIRVLTKAGTEVPRIVLQADPSRQCRVLFKIQAGVQDYYVYYGNLGAKAPAQDWRPETGIVMMEVPGPQGGFPGNNFVPALDDKGRRTGLTRDAWKSKRVPAWPKPPPASVRYVNESVPRKRLRSGRHALFVFRLEVTSADRPYWVRKKGPGIAVDGILFLDNAMHVISGGPQPVNEKLLVLTPGIHTVEVWGGAVRLDQKLNKYVPFTHDFVYRAPEARTRVGKAEYSGGNVAAYGKVAGLLKKAENNERLYWLYVAGASLFPVGKVPGPWLSFIDKFERDNWSKEWRAFGGGPKHYRPSKIDVVIPLQVLKRRIGNNLEPRTQPVVYQMTTIMGAAWGEVEATGRWRAEFINPITSTPACIGGRVFLGTHNNTICAISMRTGEVLWETPTGFYVRSSPAVWRGMVFVGCSDNNLYALSGADGKILWKYQTRGWIESSPAVADGVVYFGSFDHNFYAVDANTGKLKWKFETGFDCSGSPVIVGNDVIFASDDGRLICLNRSNGSRRWEFKFEGYAPGMPAVSGNNVYIGTTTGKIYAVNKSNGQKVWEAGGMGEIGHAVFASANALIATSRNAHVYALNLANGQRLSAVSASSGGLWPHDYMTGPVVTQQGLIVWGGGGWWDHRDFLGHGGIVWFKIK
ncbi:MAG: PQQ-binding-like beta-propeller repeat protein [Planctomycetia bacterium]|nr:PQQ-binding-like beta-propeller repeat protein [Planctomycetia bacterium]